MSNEKKEFEILFRDIYPKLYYAAQQIVKDDEMCRDFISYGKFKVSIEGETLHIK